MFWSKYFLFYTLVFFYVCEQYSVAAHARKYKCDKKKIVTYFQEFRFNDVSILLKIMCKIKIGRLKKRYEIEANP